MARTNDRHMIGDSMDSDPGQLWNRPLEIQFGSRPGPSCQIVCAIEGLQFWVPEDAVV